VARVADNPIVFASDGFVDVTGYSRRDIVPRNCRFLQGPQTDKLAVRRLKTAIENAEESVELLLNYRKNGEPFWNLLYVSPLFDEAGTVRFFLGGQINCSTTIHSCTDILRVLSLNDDGVDDNQLFRVSSSRAGSTTPSIRSRSSFFKSFKITRPSGQKVTVRSETGMEGELIDKLGKMDFQTQVEAFYTAYSKV
jgi:PAS domain S-box-containing protein